MLFRLFWGCAMISTCKLDIGLTEIERKSQCEISEKLSMKRLVGRWDIEIQVALTCTT